MREWRGPALAVGFVLVGLAATFLLFERAEIEVDKAASQEARQNPYLAVQRLLERRGVQVESAPALTEETLADADTVLWLTSSRLGLVHRNEAVADWLHGGGRLLLGLPGWDAEADPLVKLLVGRQGQLVADALTADGVLVGPYAHTDDGSSILVEQVPHLRDPVALTCEVGDVLGVVGVFGAGRLGLLADADRYTSQRIADSEGAALFWDLTRQLEPRGRVLLVYSESTPGFAAVLWKYARPAVISGLVLLLVWLVHASRRFGPPVPARERAQRALLEHVAATGSLLWRQGAESVLIDSVRAAVRRRLAVARADWAHLDDHELAPRLAELVELDSAEVLAALADPASKNPSAFARQIKNLQQLRAALGGSS